MYIIAIKGRECENIIYTYNLRTTRFYFIIHAKMRVTCTIIKIRQIEKINNKKEWRLAAKNMQESSSMLNHILYVILYPHHCSFYFSSTQDSAERMVDRPQASPFISSTHIVLYSYLKNNTNIRRLVVARTDRRFFFVLEKLAVLNCRNYCSSPN